MHQEWYLLAHLLFSGKENTNDSMCSQKPKVPILSQFLPVKRTIMGAPINGIVADIHNYFLIQH